MLGNNVYFPILMKIVYFPVLENVMISGSQKVRHNNNENSGVKSYFPVLGDNKAILSCLTLLWPHAANSAAIRPPLFGCAQSCSS